jgi:hypothetical protein
MCYYWSYQKNYGIKVCMVGPLKVVLGVAEVFLFRKAI